MKDNLFLELFKKFNKDLFILFLYSIVYLYLNSNNYEVKANVNDQGHEYDIVYDHSSIEISFRRSSKDIENLSEYIERKLYQNNNIKITFLFVVDNKENFEKLKEIKNKFENTNFIVIQINENEPMVIENYDYPMALESIFNFIKTNIEDLRTQIPNFVNTTQFLISPLTSKELTKQYRIMFVFAYFILVKYIDFRLATRNKNISKFVKHLVKNVDIDSKECLEKEWLILIKKCENIFKIRFSTKINNLIEEISIFEKTIQDLPDNPLKEDIKNLLIKYGKRIKC